VTLPYLLKAFEKGADGVMVLTCGPNECRQLEGNLRASKRAAAVDGILEEIGLGAGRIVVFAKDHEDTQGVVKRIEQFQEALSAMRTPDHRVKPLTGAGRDTESHAASFETDGANRRETAA
jgi:coenzyme F420-reducing hydrogenase delta subunit